MIVPPRELNFLDAEKALVDIELESLSLYKLFQTFQKVLQRFDDESNRPVPKIINYAYNIDEQQSFLLSMLYANGKVKFENIFLTLENRMHAVVTFLALLELLNTQKVKINQGDGANNFWVSIQEEVISE